MVGTFINKYIRIVGYSGDEIELFDIRTHKRWWVNEEEFQQIVE